MGTLHVLVITPRECSGWYAHRLEYTHQSTIMRCYNYWAVAGVSFSCLCISVCIRYMWFWVHLGCINCLQHQGKHLALGLGPFYLLPVSKCSYSKKWLSSGSEEEEDQIFERYAK